MGQKELSVAEVARVASCHPNTVRRHEKRGLIHASRDICNFRWFTLQDALKLRDTLNYRSPPVNSTSNTPPDTRME